MAQDVLSDLNEILISFRAMSGIEAALITTPGGINLASIVPPGTNPDTLAAMSSTVQNAGNLMITQLEKGHSKRVVVECEHSKLVVISAGPKAHFIVLATDNINLGPLFVEMNNTAMKIEELLSA